MVRTTIVVVELVVDHVVVSPYGRVAAAVAAVAVISGVAVGPYCVLVVIAVVVAHTNTVAASIEEIRPTASITVAVAAP